MLHASFWSMRDSAFEVYKSMEVLLDEFGWEAFSDEGVIRCEAYEILTGAFKRSDGKAELAHIVAGEIYGLWKDLREERKQDDPESQAEAARISGIAKYLIRYISHNCEEEYWGEHPEYNRYDYDHKEWGW